MLSYFLFIAHESSSLGRAARVIEHTNVPGCGPTSARTTWGGSRSCELLLVVNLVSCGTRWVLKAPVAHVCHFGNFRARNRIGGTRAKWELF